MILKLNEQRQHYTYGTIEYNYVQCCHHHSAISSIILPWSYIYCEVSVIYPSYAKQVLTKSKMLKKHAILIVWINKFFERLFIGMSNVMSILLLLYHFCIYCVFISTIHRYFL